MCKQELDYNNFIVKCKNFNTWPNYVLQINIFINSSIEENWFIFGRKFVDLKPTDLWILLIYKVQDEKTDNLIDLTNNPEWI